MAARRAYVPWTEEETAALEAGIALYGDGSWGAICSDPHYAPVLRRREPTQLKDRARTLRKQAAAQSKAPAPPAGAVPAPVPAPKPAPKAKAPPAPQPAPEAAAAVSPADDGRFDDDCLGLDDAGLEVAAAAPKAAQGARKAPTNARKALKAPAKPRVAPTAPGDPLERQQGAVTAPPVPPPLRRSPDVAVPPPPRRALVPSPAAPPPVPLPPPPLPNGLEELPMLVALRRGFEQAVAAHTAPLAALHASLGVQLGGLQQQMADGVETHVAALAAARAEAAIAIQAEPRSPAAVAQPEWRIGEDLEDDGAIIAALQELSPRAAAVALAVGRSLAAAAERKRARGPQGLPAAQHRRSV